MLAYPEYGAIQQGKASKREADYNAAVQDNNAISAGYAAIQEGQAAQREADAIREQRTRVIGSQRSAAAASGLALSGSFYDVASDSTIQAERDAHMALYRGQMGAYNQLNTAGNYRSQATMTRAAGNSAKRNSYWQAGSTLLSGAASASGSYATFRKG